MPIRAYSLYAERLGLLAGLRRTLRLTFHTVGVGDQAVELIGPLRPRCKGWALTRTI